MVPLAVRAISRCHPPAQEGSVSSLRLRRSVAVASSALLALMLIGPGSAIAANPGWAFENVGAPPPPPVTFDVSKVYLPAAVTPGAQAGYTFRIANRGSSNISQLFLTDNVAASASDPQRGITTYLDSSRAGCSAVGTQLLCSYGALNSGETIDVTVAYTTPSTGAAFPITFELNTTGVSGDKGGNSHGDTLKLPLSTALDATKNFAGRFTADLSDVQTDTSLSKKNPQSSAVTPPSAFIPVTIQDGTTVYPGTGTDPCTATGVTCIGDWTTVNVNNGNAGPVKLTLVLYGPSVPNGATVDNIDFWHDGTVISTRCDSTITQPTNIECITVTKVGNNFQIVAWLLHNGTGRGQF